MDILLSPVFWMSTLPGLGFGLIGLTSAVFLHELGHAVAAWCYGMRVTHFHIRPWGGHCSFKDDARSDEVYANPVSRGIVYAGGALANALAMVLCLVLFQCDVAPDASFCILWLATANGLLALQVAFSARVPASDGAEILEAWEEYREARQPQQT